MATNPNNAFGTNASFSGRTTVNAFNDDLAAYDGRGVLSGFKVTPGTGMEILLGGEDGIRDVAILEDNNGNRTTLDNRLGTPISLTIAPAPTTGTRIDALVAYVTNPPVSNGLADGYDTIGYLGVQSENTSDPTQPTDDDIRAAITADGGSGTTAYYVVFGYVRVTTGTTDITPDLITTTEPARIRQDVVPVTMVGTSRLENGAVTEPKIATNAVTSAKIATGAVTSTQLGSNSVTTAKINNLAVTTEKINDSAVTTAKLGSGAVTNDKLGTGAVGADNIAANAVTTAKISDLNVTTGKLANGAVTGVTNTATTIGTAKLALNTVGTGNLRDSAVSAAKLASSAVTSDKIASGAVTSDKVDWATLKYGFVSGSGNLTFTANYTEIAVPNTELKFSTVVGGVYAIFFGGQLRTPSSAATKEVYLDLKANGNRAGSTSLWTYGISGTYALNLPASSFITYTANSTTTTLNLVSRIGSIQSGNSTYEITGNMMVFRIA